MFIYLFILVKMTNLTDQFNHQNVDLKFVEHVKIGTGKDFVF